MILVTGATGNNGGEIVKQRILNVLSAGPLATTLAISVPGWQEG